MLLWSDRRLEGGKGEEKKKEPFSAIDRRSLVKSMTYFEIFSDFPCFVRFPTAKFEQLIDFFFFPVTRRTPVRQRNKNNVTWRGACVISRFLFKCLLLNEWTLRVGLKQQSKCVPATVQRWRTFHENVSFYPDAEMVVVVRSTDEDTRRKMTTK